MNETAGGGYARVSSEEIVYAIRKSGGHARIARRPTLQGVAVYNQQYRADLAIDLAADRIEELEARLAAEEGWMAELMGAVSTHNPGDRPAEYLVAWKSLCKDARNRYQALAQVIFREFNRRERERLDREMA